MAEPTPVVRWPNIPPEFATTHPEVAQGIRLLYNAIDDHKQAFEALKPQVDEANKTATKAASSAAKPSGGAITSVGLQMPPEFQVSNSPLVASGVIQVAKQTQGANEVYAGPTTGADADPIFRLVVPADLPIATVPAVGAVKPDGTTITIDPDGTIHGAPAFDISTTVLIEDDMVGLNNGGGVSGPGGFQGSQTTGADYEQTGIADPAFYNKIGVMTGTINNNTGVLAGGGVVFGFSRGQFLPDSTTFDFRCSVRFSLVSSHFSVSVGCGQAPPFGARLDFEYDPINNGDSGGDVHIVAYSPGIGVTRTSSGFTLDTDWHEYRIRCTVIGTIEFLIDGVSVGSLTTNIPPAQSGFQLMPMVFWAQENAGVTSLQSVDWVKFTMPRG